MAKKILKSDHFHFLGSIILYVMIV